VLDLAGTPVEGASIAVSTPFGLDGTGTRTAADGTFQGTRWDERDAFAILAHHPAYGAGYAFPECRRGSCSTAGLVIQLRSDCGEIEGRVVGSTGRPLRAPVLVISGDYGLALWAGRADSDGRFSAAGLPSGPVAVEARSPVVWRSRVRARVDVVSGTTTEVETVVLETHEGAVGGVVLLPELGEAARVRLALQSRDGRVDLVRNVWGKPGQRAAAFRFDGLPDGGYELQVNAYEHGRVRRIVRAGETDLMVPLVPVALLRGQIADPAGRTGAGTSVYALWIERSGTGVRCVTETEHVWQVADGFSVYLTARSPVDIVVVRGRRTSTVPANSKPGEVVDVGTAVLGPPARITGRVVHGDGSPAHDTSVALACDDVVLAKDGSPIGETRTDSDGRFDLLAPTGLLAVSVVIGVRGRWGWETRVSTPEEGVVDVGTLTLPALSGPN